jgi:hypothetical protein
MTLRPRESTRWGLVVLFAIGMAWVEAACVYYLRVLVDRVQPYQVNPLPVHEVLGSVELVREASTLVMLLTLGMLAGRTLQTRLGYTAIAFGAWDIFYYVFLKLICDWPSSLLDWDILFLIPLPWWGPVLAPVSIAVLMIVWGTLVTQRTVSSTVTAVASALWGLSGIGVVLALYVFMADALSVVHQGVDATRTVLPQTFNWPLFAVAFALMAAPVAHAVRRPPREGSLRNADPLAAPRYE